MRAKATYTEPFFVVMNVSIDNCRTCAEAMKDREQFFDLLRHQGRRIFMEVIIHELLHVSHRIQTEGRIDMRARRQAGGGSYGSGAAAATITTCDCCLAAAVLRT